MTHRTSITYGPFRAAYHRELVDRSLRDDFRAFVERELRPQVDHLVDETVGSFVARFDNELHCGPNSVVRDMFRFDLAFQGDGQRSEIQSNIEYDPTARIFTTWRGRPLYVWTPSRKGKREEDNRRIGETIDSIDRRERSEYACPTCGTLLRIANDEWIFEVSCPSGCFVYNFHKDGEGRLLHGHFFVRDPK